MQEAHLKVLRLIESRPNLTQRQVARELGISLGKVNYCVNTLIEKGWIKACNFRNNKNKLSAGTRVRFTAGLFIGLEGIFEMESEDARVIVLLTLLGKTSRVTVNRDCLAVAC